MFSGIVLFIIMIGTASAGIMLGVSYRSCQKEYREEELANHLLELCGEIFREQQRLRRILRGEAAFSGTGEIRLSVERLKELRQEWECNKEEYMEIERKADCRRHIPVCSVDEGLLHRAELYLQSEKSEEIHPVTFPVTCSDEMHPVFA